MTGPAAADLPLKLWVARLSNGISPASLAQAHADWLLHLLVQPSKQRELAASAVHKAAHWGAAVAVGSAHEDPLLRHDKRFARDEWQSLPFAAAALGFLLQQQWWDEATHGVRGVSRHHEELAAFVARQWLDMVSPSNSVATNPQVIKETLLTAGANLAGGALNWWRDAMAVASDGKPRGVEAYAPGAGVAATPGKVVMRNDLVELIQYEPATPSVGREPVFIVPSWIMKFYILDLTPDDSLVKYLVDRGHTVFIVSWRNPGGADSDLGMADYLRCGITEPVAFIRSSRPGTRLQGVGYCLGGTLLATAAALSANAHAFKTITLLAAQADFSEPGELGLFMDESQVAFLEDIMAEHGFLDGRRMAGAFQLINSKDLVWSKLVHEYLMGAHTPMTALRAWNADATRMPARMHSEYLRSLYLRNDLAEGRYSVDGELVDLCRVTVPMFVLATEKDHVSPWRSVYRIQRLLHSPVTFVLTSGGHNVGIVNPPEGPAAHPKASYRASSSAARAAPPDPDAWLAGTSVESGSWWPCWDAWLRTHSRGQVPARPVRAPRYEGRIVPAPGTYVLEQ